MNDAAETNLLRISADALSLAIEALFRHIGCSEEAAETITRHLLEANLTGHDSHGIIRVPRYVDAVLAGEVVPGRHARVVRENPISMVVDGQRGFGQIIAEETMGLLAAKTLRSGMAIAAIRNCGHLGRIGGWGEELARARLISLHFVNTTGKGMMVTPFGGSDRRMSLNPVCICVPRHGREPLLLDFTTAMCAEGKVAVARNAGRPMPDGYLVDPQGAPTQDPEDFYAGGAVLPFGGYKGHGLNLMADILAGGLSGGGMTQAGETVLTNTMTSIALDPAIMVEDMAAFEAEIERYVDWVKASPPLDPARPVLAPGDPEQTVREERHARGIPVDATTWQQIAAAAEKAGMPVDRFTRLAEFD